MFPVKTDSVYGVSQHIADDFRVLKQLMVRVTPIGTTAAVAGLFSDIEERMLFQQITDAPQGERTRPFLATDFLVEVVDFRCPEAVFVVIV